VTGDPSWVSVVSLAVSMAALLASVLWGWFIWRRAGESLSVSGDLRPPLFQGARNRPVRVGEALGVVTIMAANRGRTATEVHSLWLVTKGGVRIKFPHLEEGSASLPATLGARNRAYWYLSPQALGLITKQRGNPLVVRPLVESGPGTLTRGRWLRIAVRDEHLPGLGQHFRPTINYRLRRRLRRL
jgi:hypothetical protein